MHGTSDALAPAELTCQHFDMRIARSYRVGFYLGAALGVAVGAGGLFLRTLTRDQQLAFLGSAFGALVAALTALGVVEYSAHTERRAGKRIMSDLLRRIENAATCPEGKDTPRQSITATLCLAVDQAKGVAIDLRAKVPGMAATVAYLTNAENLLSEMGAGERRVTDSEMMKIRSTLQGTAAHCRDILEGISDFAGDSSDG